MVADNSQLIVDTNAQPSASSNQCLLPAGLDVDYVRNILLKYLEYMASGDN